MATIYNMNDSATQKVGHEITLERVRRRDRLERSEWIRDFLLSVPHGVFATAKARSPFGVSNIFVFDHLKAFLCLHSAKLGATRSTRGAMDHWFGKYAGDSGGNDDRPTPDGDQARAETEGKTGFGSFHRALKTRLKG